MTTTPTQAAPTTIPADVLRALDRMCTPLHESRLAGATAEADAHSMKIIRDYIFAASDDLIRERDELAEEVKEHRQRQADVWKTLTEGAQVSPELRAAYDAAREAWWTIPPEQRLSPVQLAMFVAGIENGISLASSETRDMGNEEIEMVIACLGDDAAMLRGLDQYEEVAANMEHAAELLGTRASEAAPAQGPVAVADLPAFPTMLRKIWNGAEVQQWIDDCLKPLFQERHFSFHCDTPTPWQIGNPPIREGAECEFIVAVRRKHNGKVYVCAATFANKYDNEMIDRDGETFIADGWFTCGADMSGEVSSVYAPLLESGDEVLGWQSLPIWGAPTPEAAPVAAGDAKTLAHLTDIHTALHTQDNRITSEPMFAVQQRQRVYGIATDYDPKIAWVNDDSDEVDAEKAAELEAAYQQDGDDRPGNYKRLGYHEYWDFVTACFTEQGCKDYIARNGHNLHETRIYAYGTYRNAEWATIRDFLMSDRFAALASQAATDAGQPSDKLRALALDFVADMEHDGEGNAKISASHIDRLCRLADFAGIEGALQNAAPVAEKGESA